MGIWDELGAGAYTALDNILFGAPGAIVNAIDSNAAKELDKWRREHPEAMAVGDIAGLVGGLLIPGGAISKGVGKVVGGAGKLVGKIPGAVKAAEAIGKGAKALDTVGDIIKGAKTIGKGGGKAMELGGSVLRGALTAAEQALPRAAFSEDAREGLLPSLLLGGALGGGTKGLGMLTKRLAKGSTLASAGLTSKILDEEAVFGLPKKARLARGAAKESFSDKAADYLTANKLLKPKKILAHLEKNPMGKDVYQEAEEAYKKLSSKAKASAMLSSDDAVDLISEYGPAGEKAIKTLTKEVERMPLIRAKDYLGSMMLPPPGANMAQMARAAAARTIKANLDDVAMKGIDPARVEAARELYPLRVALEKAVEKGSGAPGGFVSGSPTSLNQTIAALVSGGGMQKIGGAGVGMGISGFDISKPETWGPAALGGMAGAALGPTLARAAPRWLNSAVAKASGMTGAPGVSKVAGMAAPVLGKIFGDKEGGAAAGGSVKSAEKAVAATEAAIETAAPEAAEGIKEEAKAEVNAVFMGEIEERLYSDWLNNGWAESGIKFKDFFEEVRKVTDNFDPKESVKILFKDKASREEYLRQYDQILMFKGMDIESALGYEGATSPFLSGIAKMAAAGGIGDPGFLKRQAEYESLKNIFENIATKPGQQPRATLLKEIEEDVASIARMKISPEEKRARIIGKLEEAGLNLDMRKWGLI